MSKQPTTERPMIRTAYLSSAVDAMLEPLSGDDLEMAQHAIKETHDSGPQAQASELRDIYAEAVADAVGEEVDEVKARAEEAVA